MEEAGEMTVKVRKFGTYLLTRADAQALLGRVEMSGSPPVFNFEGVAVANHPFADELAKGLVAGFPSCDLSKIALVGANPYVKNCLEAGFSSAVDH